MKKLPIGRQEFSKLIEDNCVYVDKTKHIYRVIETGKDENFVGILQDCLGPEGCQVTKPFICENFPIGIRTDKRAAILLFESCPQFLAFVPHQWRLVERFW